MIVNRQRDVRFARKPLEMFLRRVKRELGVQPFAVTVCFVSDLEIAGMNERFRKKAGPTDVLSFPASKKCPAVRRQGKGSNTEILDQGANRQKRHQRPGRPAAERYLGDIAIAPATARRYAKKKGRSLRSELRVLILHGVLHLMGYDHETDNGEMNRMEREMRRRFGLA